jgi:hypothetical protein
VGFCWDGVRALTDRRSGVVSKIKEVALDMNWVHCFIRREAFALKGMPPEFKTVLDSAVKLVNYIKARPLNNGLFSLFCDEMASEYAQLLLHSEIHWLSRVKVLAKLFQLRHEVSLFVNEHNSDSASLIADEAWLLALSYLSDNFSKLNEVNLSSGKIFSSS